jgi:hypothetical protein
MRPAITSRLTLAAAILVTAAVPCSAAVRLIGVGAIPGTATDASGLTRLLEDGATHDNQIGGLGSAIAYTGVGDVYLATPDRGPANGLTTYTDRAYVLRVSVTPSASQPGGFAVTPNVISTVILRAEDGRPFTGDATAFDPTNSPASHRLDPEGIRAARCGDGFFVSDEYGPFLYEFGPSGRRRRALALPEKLLIDLPSADGDAELAGNLSGRQANRGMEGLAISPDGSKLYGLMQSPLLQDGALDAKAKRVGTNNRLVEVDIKTGALREFLYTLDDPGNGVNEILAVNDHEFLVIERDGKAGASAAFKKIFHIDIAGATNIRGQKQLPRNGAPADVVPVSKTLFIDLLDPAFGIAGPSAPEKVEGLAFGPDLADGRHLLVVTTDNDFVPTQPSLFFAFGVDASDLPGFVPQHLDPLCAPSPLAGAAPQ